MIATGPEVRSTERTGIAVLGSVAATVLVWRAFARFGVDGNGAAWAVTQVVLVFLACFDIATRRVPNRILAPAALVVLVLRAAFTPSTLVACFVAAAAAFAAFLLIAVMTRGGLGMGDVKLAGLIGLLLGHATVSALFIGIVAGGIASAIVLFKHRDRRQAIPYAPYLCFGAVFAVLAVSLPPLI